MVEFGDMENPGLTVVLFFTIWPAMLNILAMWIGVEWAIALVVVTVVSLIVFDVLRGK